MAWWQPPTGGGEGYEQLSGAPPPAISPDDFLGWLAKQGPAGDVDRRLQDTDKSFYEGVVKPTLGTIPMALGAVRGMPRVSKAPMANPEVAATVKALRDPRLVTLTPDVSLWEGKDFFGMTHGGRGIGYIESARPWADHLEVHNWTGPGSNTLGPTVTRDILRQLKAFYQKKHPGETFPTIGGFRVSGSRAVNPKNITTRFAPAVGGLGVLDSSEDR